MRDEAHSRIRMRREVDVQIQCKDISVAHPVRNLGGAVPAQHQRRTRARTGPVDRGPVEAVADKTRALAGNQAVFDDLRVEVSERGVAAVHDRAALEDAGARTMTVGILDVLEEVHEAAALREDRHSGAGGIMHGPPHAVIRLYLARMQLRIPAAEV